MNIARSRVQVGKLLRVFFLALGLLLPVQIGFADPTALQERVVSLFREHNEAIVRVKAVYPPSEPGGVPHVVIGTGFFISREGLIITNASIVANPLRVWVEHRNVAFGAEVVGSDDRTNLAFLRLRTLPDAFNFLHLSDKAEMPTIGNFLVRLSMPLEFDVSPSIGIVSGIESRFGDRFFPCNYIRTNIPAGPGDGGSAYLDLTGRLVGIQVGSLPDIQSSYILPSRAALRIRDDILFSGKVTYGWIGFEVELQSSIDTGPRVVLKEILADSPAADSGLVEGDVLKRVGEYSIRFLDDLRNAMFYTRVGHYVEIHVLRGDKPRRFYVRVATRPADEPMEYVTPIEESDILHPLRDAN